MKSIYRVGDHVQFLHKKDTLVIGVVHSANKVKGEIAYYFVEESNGAMHVRTSSNFTLKMMDEIDELVLL